MRVVKSFAREPRQLERFRHSVARVFDQSMISTRLEAKYNPMIGFLPQLGLAAVLLIGGRSVIHAHLTLGQFSQFYLYLNMLIAPMRSLGVILGLAQRATASGARIFQVLDREPRILEAPDAPPLPPGTGHVEFRGVSLRYDDLDDFGATYTAPGERNLSLDHSNGNRAAQPVRTVLSGLDLDIAAGSTVALVGATGSGKTSLVSLISRLYEASEGRILLDGADMRTVDLSSLREAVAVVSDDPFLFSAIGRREHRLRAPDPHRSRKSSRPPVAPRPMTSSWSFRRASTRAWASVDCRCPVGSDSGSRSPARCWPTRAC